MDRWWYGLKIVSRWFDLTYTLKASCMQKRYNRGTSNSYQCITTTILVAACVSREHLILGWSVSTRPCGRRACNPLTSLEANGDSIGFECRSDTVIICLYQTARLVLKTRTEINTLPSVTTS